MPRTFESYDASAVKKPKGLLIGITGPQFSGKSYSAGELATGIKEVYGREIYWVDTENDRALELAPYFKFKHVPFNQPKSPLEYYDVLKYVISQDDCGVCIIDQCSHEHTAFLQMIEDYLQAKAGDDYDARERYKFVALVRPSAERKRFNELAAYGAIGKDGRKIPLILLYRGRDKTKPGKSKREGGDGKPVHMGWQSETTSDLPYNMTIRFLLPPGSDGHPNLTPDTEWEKLAVRTPVQFRDWFKPGFQLNRAVGRRLAEWAIGDSVISKDDMTAAIIAERRTSLLAEIKSLLATLPSQDAKKSAVAGAFNCPWPKVEKLPDDALAAGLAKLRSALQSTSPSDPAPIPAGDHRDRITAKAASVGLPLDQIAGVIGGPLADLPPDLEPMAITRISEWADEKGA